jgi:hypothetical protein
VGACQLQKAAGKAIRIQSPSTVQKSHKSMGSNTPLLR